MGCGDAGPLRLHPQGSNGVLPILWQEHAFHLLYIIRAAPLLRAKVKITVKHTVCEESSVSQYGVFDWEFGFDSRTSGAALTYPFAFCGPLRTRVVLTMRCTTGRRRRK